jgi:hypothetical protein
MMRYYVLENYVVEKETYTWVFPAKETSAFRSQRNRSMTKSLLVAIISITPTISSLESTARPAKLL